MNWRAISFDWNQVRAFLATAEEGSLSAAARALGTTQPTIGRQVAALEEALSVTLFERGGRSLRLTDAGAQLAEHVRGMADAAARVSLVAAGQSQEVTGRVVVTAVDIIATTILPGVLADLRQQAPGLVIEVVASNDIRNLLRREADIAIRHVRPDSPDLIATRVADFGAGLYAASAYLDRLGRPRTPEDLARFDVVGSISDDDFVSVFARLGVPFDAARIAARSESGLVMWEFVRAGVGIGVMPDLVAGPDPVVEPALPGLPGIGFPVWLVTHANLRRSRRIRVVYDALHRALTGAA